MADAKVEVLITAKDQASKVFSKVGGAAEALGSVLTTSVVAGAAAMAAGLGASVKSAADFEQQMSAVSAVSGATGEEMAQLSKLAMDLGKDTSFSASEAAKGLEELVKGGVTIPDIMNGAAQATLNLAAAGGTDLANAAAIASNALNTFNLNGSDMAHVSDLIAGAANASAIDVNDFQLSLAAAGSVVATAGGTFDDLAVAIAAMGNAGIKGSDAGTSLKTMMLNLQPTTKDQIELFRELGLVTADGANQFFNAQGQMKPMAEISGILQKSLADLTQEQKLAALETMFGTDAIRAASVMSNLGAEGFNELAASMGKVSAETVAAERLNNLAGDMEQLQGSVETAGIALGTAFLPPLREAAQGATKFVNENIIPFIEEHGPGFAAAVSNAGKSLAEGAGNLMDNAKKAADEGLGTLSTKIGEAKASLQEWADGAGPAGQAVVDALDGAQKGADALQKLLKGDFKGAAEDAAKALDSLKSSADNLKTAFDELRKQNDETMKRIGDTTEAKELGSEFDELKGATSNLQKAFGSASEAQKEWNTAVDNLSSALGIQKGAMDSNVSGMDITKIAIGLVTDKVREATRVIESITTILHAMDAGWRAAAAGANALADAARNARQQVEAIPRNVTSTITTIKETVEHAVTARQAGGPVHGGHPYIVGEKGPEIFVPGSSGAIVNNRDATSTMGPRGGSQGGPIVLQVDGTTLGVLSQAYGTRRVGLSTL